MTQQESASCLRLGGGAALAPDGVLGDDTPVGTLGGVTSDPPQQALVQDFSGVCSSVCAVH